MKYAVEFSSPITGKRVSLIEADCLDDVIEISGDVAANFEEQPKLMFSQYDPKDNFVRNVHELKEGFLKFRTDAIETVYSVLLDLYYPATPLPQGPRVYTLEQIREAIILARNDAAK